MDKFELRPMQQTDRAELAELIYLSTNVWYQAHGRSPAFSGGPETADLFFEVYDALDPGCGVVAVSTYSGRLAGSCFYHPRPTHVSLGIMNVHPNYFGRGVARALLQYVIDFAQRQQKPVRLVSSAMNLDSYSLYNRAGFVPQMVFQDLVLPVPGRRAALSHRRRRVRPSGHRGRRRGDGPAGDRTGRDLRPQDYRYFLANAERAMARFGLRG